VKILGPKTAARAASILLLASLLAGCATGFTSIYDKPDGKTLVVSQRDWSAYQTYLNKVGAVYHGAFAVSVYGGRTDGYGYSDCPGSSCFAGKSFATEAMDLCRKGGSECVLFAVNNKIVVNYKLEAQ